MHFILSFKYHVFHARRPSERHKHVAVDDGTINPYPANVENRVRFS